MKQQSVFRGTVILTISGFFNKGLGFLLQIYLARAVGDRGLGLFQMVYPLFITLTLICTASLPLSLSKIIPEKLSCGKNNTVFKLLKISLLFTFLAGTFSAGSLYLMADFISINLYQNPDVYHILLSISPVLAICPLTSVFEGYFQGYKTMKPTALAHTTGKFNRVTATIIFLELVRNLELKYRVAGIGIGLFVGELTALLILVYLFLLHHKNSIHSQKSNHQNRSSYREIIKELARFSLPITSGRLINSIIQSTKAVLIPFQLTKSGLPETKAAAVYGQLSGMAQQIIFLPSIITSSLTKSLIPALSEAYSRQNFRKIEKNYQDLIRIITYLGFPLTVIFNLYGPEICQLVYSHPEAGKILSHLSFSVTFIYYLQVSSGMLHGLGKPKLALRNLALGNLTQLIGIFLLVKFPALRIQGAVIAITGGSIGAALLNYLNLGQIIDFPKNISLLFYKPLLGSSIIYFINFIFRQYIYRQTGTIISGFNLIIILSVNLIIYIIFMFLCGAITRTDLKKIH